MNSFILSGFADEIDQSLELQITEMKAHGISYIEMRGVNDKNIADYTIDEIKAIKKQLDENKMKISALGSPFGKINIKDEFEPHFEKFKNGIALAKELDTKYIRMFSFYITDGTKPEDCRDEVLRRLKLMVDYAAENDIILLHENEKEIYGDTAERCLDLLSTINSPYFKATFDPANLIQCGGKPYEDYELLKDYVVYFHIKDALSSTGAVVPAGQGDGQIEKLLSRIKADGFNGFLSLEPHLGNFKGFSDIELDDRYSMSEKAGPKTFAVAVKALKEILNRI